MEEQVHDKGALSTGRLVSAAIEGTMYLLEGRARELEGRAAAARGQGDAPAAVAFAEELLRVQGIMERIRAAADRVIAEGQEQQRWPHGDPA